MLKDSELLSAVWHALEKLAGKEKRREALADGAAYPLNLAIAGEVAGQPIDRLRIAGKLTVGHEQTRSSSTAPAAGHVLALVLAMLNQATREKILRELPETFAAAGGVLPEADQAIVEAANGLFARLRAKIETTAKGPVACNYTLAVDP